MSRLTIPQAPAAPAAPAADSMRSPALAVINGALLGLGIALGVWLPDALALAGANVRLVWPVALMGLVLVTLTTAAAGYVAGQMRRGALALLVWLLAAVVVAVIVGRLPYDGRNWVVWVTDPAFRGKAAYLFDEPALLRLYLGTFFIVLLLAIVGLLQAYRLEAIANALNRGRLTVRAALLLLLPVPLAVGAGYAADNLISRPLRQAPQLVHHAIETVRGYSGDLFQLSQSSRVNYNALRGVRDRLTANYSLMLGDIDLGAAQTVFVVADFDTGAWLYCRVQATGLSHCYDPSPPYTRGFQAALTGASLEDCPACGLRMADDLRAWLLEQGRAFRGEPEITRLGQWGRYALMEARDPAGDRVVRCFFEGMTPVSVESCEVGS